MGGACGLAISAAILQATLRSNLPSEFSYLTESSYSLPSRTTLTDAQWTSILLAYTKASHAVFILQVPLIGVCFLACVFIRDRGLERPKEPEEIEEEKRKAEQAERDAEAALPQECEGQEAENKEMMEQRQSTSTLVEPSMPPSRAEPDLSNVEEKQNSNEK
jgi:hypothetical protein